MIPLRTAGSRSQRTYSRMVALFLTTGAPNAGEAGARYCANLDAGNSPLLPYVTGSAHRRLQDAIGYRVVEARPPTLATRQDD